MFCFVSPAKKMDFNTVRNGIAFTDTAFPEKTTQVLGALQSYDVSDLKKLMKLSDSLAELNAKRFKEFDAAMVNHAVFAFTGDTYVGLDVKTLSEEMLAYAQTHLGIVSGLYGLLRPFDGIKPYRLEMGCGLRVADKKDLYAFWGDDIANRINQRAKEVEAKAVINLASQEYAKAVKADMLDMPLITVDFKEVKDGVAKTVGLHAKRARGMMARYIIQNRLTNPNDVKDFDWKDYGFDDSVSTENHFVFKR